MKGLFCNVPRNHERVDEAVLLEEIPQALVGTHPQDVPKTNVMDFTILVSHP
jgi:hypothetical protein